MIKIAEINIDFPISKFSILVSYFTKRKPTAFEDIILKSVEKLRLNKNFSSMKLFDFLEKYLLIADAEQFVKPTIENLKFLKLITYSDDYNFKELLFKDITVTEDAKKMQIKGFIPSEDLEEKIESYWNPITNQILDRSNENLISIGNDDSSILLEELKMENIFPEQLMTDNIVSGNIMKKFTKRRDELRNIKNIKEEKKVFYKKIKHEVMLDENFNIIINISSKRNLEYSDKLKTINYEKIKTILTSSLRDEVENIDHFTSRVDNINSFLELNKLNSYFSNNSKIKVFGYVDEISDIIINNLKFDNHKNQLNILYAEQSDNRIVFDKSKFNCTIYLNKKIPLRNCIFCDSDENNVFNANFKFICNNNSIISNQYYSIKHGVEDYDFYIEDIENVIDDSNDLDNTLIKLHWSSAVDVWNEIFHKIIEKNDIMSVDSLITILKRMIAYGIDIKKIETRFSDKEDINTFLREKIKQIFFKKNDEIKQFSDFILSNNKTFTNTKQYSSILIDNNISTRKISELKDFILSIQGLELTGDASKKLLDFVRDIISNNSKSYELKDIIEITNIGFFAGDKDSLIQIIFNALSNNLSLKNFNVLKNLYSILEKSNYYKQIINFREFEEKVFPVYESNFTNDDFFDLLKGRSDIELCLKKLKQSNQNLAKFFGDFSGGGKDLVNLLNESSLRSKIIELKSLTKILDLIKEWRTNYEVIDYLVMNESNIGKINSNINDLYSIVKNYITDIPKMYENIYIIDTNIFVDKPDILDSFNQKSDYVLIPKKVLDELDGLKKIKEDSQKAIKSINEHIQYNNITIEESNMRLLPNDYNTDNPDNLILSVALKFKQVLPILLTSDINFENKAIGENLKVMNLSDYLKSKEKNSKKNKKSNKKNKKRRK